MVRIEQIIAYLEHKYPTEHACSFDQGKIGLQFGDTSALVTKVMIALDGTTAVIEEAILEGVELVITHHPFLFHPLVSLNYASPFGKKLINVLNHKLNLFSMHTNFDIAEGGMNDILAKKLGLKNICSQNTAVTPQLLRTGFINPCRLNVLAIHVKQTFGKVSVRMVGDKTKVVQKIGIIGGSGASEWQEAMRCGCDVLITGEIRHNQALEALEAGFSFIEVNHGIEQAYCEVLQQELGNVFPEIVFLISQQEVDPFQEI